MVAHGHPISWESTWTNTHTGLQNSWWEAPQHIYNTLRWGNIKKWFMKALQRWLQMVTLHYGKSHLQTHIQGSEIHDGWLSSMYIIHRGEETWNSDLCRLCEDESTTSLHPVQLHIYRYTCRFPKFKVSGIPTSMLCKCIGTAWIWSMGGAALSLYNIPWWFSIHASSVLIWGW